MEIGQKMADGRYPAGPGRVAWHTGRKDGIHMHFVAPMTRDSDLAGLQPPYEHSALAVENLQIKVERRDKHTGCAGYRPDGGTP